MVMLTDLRFALFDAAYELETESPTVVEELVGLNDCNGLLLLGKVADLAVVRWR